MSSDSLEIDKTREDLLATDGHLLIEGGPGCGKTTIALLRAKREAATLQPEQEIVFLSFSRAAVRQILDRTRTHLDADTARVLKVRTFHAMFIDVVRAHAHLLTGKPAQIITPDQENQLRSMFDGEWAEECKRMAADGLYVFDELACATADLLEKVPAVRRLLSDRFPLVIVDEFQDTNADQWRVVKSLAEKSTVIALADPDQRIYEGFVAGVDEQRIDHLVSALEPTRFDLSASNFRSPGGGILDYGNAILRKQPIPEPSQVRTLWYPPSIGAERTTQYGIIWVREQMAAELGPSSSVAVLALSNGFLAGVSAAISTPATVIGQQLPAIDHDLMWDPQLSAAAGLVIARVLGWPGQDPNSAVLETLDAVAAYYQTRLGLVIGRRGEKTTRDLLKKATLARGQYERKGRCASKLGTSIVDTVHSGVRLNGNPVADWKRASRALTGSPELDDIASKARNLPIMRTSDDLAWALHDAWDGSRYIDPALALQRVLADDLINGLGQPPAGTVLMTMHRSKGKEFDAVVIVEGKYNAKLVDWTTDIEQMRRRRLLRVAITRARHRVVFVRPQGAESLFG